MTKPVQREDAGVRIPAAVVDAYVDKLLVSFPYDYDRALEEARVQCLVGEIGHWFLLAVEATLNERGS